MMAVHAGYQPLPEAHRLGVRVVDAKDADAPLYPEQHDIEQGLI